MSKKLNQESAFPTLEYNESGYGDCIKIIIGDNINYIPFTRGMNKRYYTACIAMDSLIKVKGHLLNLKEIVKQAYEVADIMLEMEDKND